MPSMTCLLLRVCEGIGIEDAISKIFPSLSRRMIHRIADRWRLPVLAKLQTGGEP
jgi:hypothetical protein